MDVNPKAYGKLIITLIYLVEVRRKTYSEIATAIRREWCAIPQEDLPKLTKTMIKRMVGVKKNKGGHTEKYRRTLNVKSFFSLQT